MASYVPTRVAREAPLASYDEERVVLRAAGLSGKVTLLRRDPFIPHSFAPFFVATHPTINGLRAEMLLQASPVSAAGAGS